MAKEKMNLTRITNPKARKIAFKRRMRGLMKKAEDLTILCGSDACLTFFDREDNKLVAWPSLEVATSLMDRFCSLPSFERNIKAKTQESCISTHLNKIEKKLADYGERVAELEMNHLLFQLANGRSLDDLSKTENVSLRSYTNKKIMCLNKELGYPEHAYTSVNEPVLMDKTPRVLDVTSEANLMGSKSIYLMDKWFFDDPKVEEHGDGTRLPTKVPRFDLNLEPPDDEEEYM